jgi:hypothetical protein
MYLVQSNGYGFNAYKSELPQDGTTHSDSVVVITISVVVVISPHGSHCDISWIAHFNKEVLKVKLVGQFLISGPISEQ